MSNKRLVTYIAITIFCGSFSAIYEHFSHEVYSVFMVYLFVIPLVLGVVPEIIRMIAPRLHINSPWSRLFQAFAIATLTVGACLQGVVEIYGTTNGYILSFLVVGSALLMTSIGIYVLAIRRP